MKCHPVATVRSIDRLQYLVLASRGAEIVGLERQSTTKLLLTHKSPAPKITSQMAARNGRVVVTVEVWRDFRRRGSAQEGDV